MATPEQHPHLHIRPAREDDAPALREICNDAVEDGLATFDSGLRSIEDQKRLIAAAGQDARRLLLVAEVRNLVCGFVSIEAYEERLHDGEMAENVIFARSAVQGYGVGPRLMRALQRSAVRA